MQTEPTNTALPKRKRRWFQFSLRTLMLAVTIIAVQCGVCVPMLREWQQTRQEEANFDELVKLINLTVAPSTCSLSDNEGSREQPECRIADR